MKKCVRCGSSKPLSEFHNDKRRKDGKCPYCKPCRKDLDKIYLAGKKRKPGEYKIGRKEYMRRWRAANKDKLKANHKKWRDNNPEKVLAWAKRRYDKDKAIERAKAWKERNPGRVNANTAARRTRKLKATPAWADSSAIQAVYEKARVLSEETGVQHHVDHIYPLKGKEVCGLHVADNLQILTAEENYAKSSTLIPGVLISAGFKGVFKR